MAGRANRLACSSLLLAMGACQASHDLVASSYGEWDPNCPKPFVYQLDGDLAVTDPSMFLWQGTYYVFSTGFTNPSGVGVDLRSSKDRKTFKLEAPVLSPNPPWVERKLAKVTSLWSPCVAAWGGVIHLYYAASWFGADRGCIGHATATSVETGFIDDGEPVICSNIDTTDPFVAIDPGVILDEAGNPWMTFGSWADGINMLALDRNGKRLDEPQNLPFVVAARAPDEPVAIQAASLYHWRDYYYLFVSYDGSPDHILRVGRSKNVKGPYVDDTGKRMVDGGSKLLLKNDDQSTFTGPGSNMVFEDVNERVNVYHAYNATGDVVLRIGQLFFDNDGWPVSGGP
jgi:arabinan endo-1,5-alpha-L-arabinosidase